MELTKKQQLQICDNISNSKYLSIYYPNGNKTIVEGLRRMSFHVKIELSNNLYLYYIHGDFTTTRCILNLYNDKNKKISQQVFDISQPITKKMESIYFDWLEEYNRKKLEKKESGKELLNKEIKEQLNNYFNYDNIRI